MDPPLDVPMGKPSRLSGIPRPSGIPRLSRLPLHKASNPDLESPRRAKALVSPHVVHLKTPQTSQTVSLPEPEQVGGDAQSRIPVEVTPVKAGCTSWNRSPDASQREIDTKRPQAKPPSQLTSGQPQQLDNHGGTSLSERTVESIAKMPKSARRRRSSFFSTESSVISPLRPTSSGGMPDTPSRKPAPRFSSLRGVPPSLTQGTPSRPTPRRSMLPSDGGDVLGKSTQRADAEAASTSKAKVQQPRAMKRAQGNAISTSNASVPNSTTDLRRHRQKPVATKTDDSTSRSRVLKSPALVESPARDSPSKSKSSAALREQIAKAKAAQRARKSQTVFNTNESDDPFNQRLASSEETLRHRMDAARSSGRLDVSALALAELPDQILRMYEYDSNGESSVQWNEAIDLVKFIAADNEIESIPDAFFPDVDVEALDPADEDASLPQFGGIGTLDMHGNKLQKLPLGLGRLNCLTVLNLSRNRFDASVFGTISKITTLRDLRLAENDIAEIPERICHLKSLDTLELQSNKIQSLPGTLAALEGLRTLNLANNRLRSLPMGTLASMALSTLSASKNCLEGTLFPSSVLEMPTLQVLDVSCNSIEALAADDRIALVGLQTLDVSVNKISKLPRLQGWKSLVTLLASENGVAEIPEGFTSLPSIRTADFTGNDIRKIDAEVGFMEEMDHFSISANPLRERKLLSLNTDDLKAALRQKYEGSEDKNRGGRI